MSDRESGMRRKGQRPWSLLLERVLLHARPRHLRTGNSPKPDAEVASGLVLGGQNALSEARNWTRSGVTVLVDPACYEDEPATPDEPFRLPRGPTGQPALTQEAAQSLAGYLGGQRASSNLPLALTPTGYIACGNTDAVRTAVRQVVDETDQETTVLVLPLDGAWLNDARDVDFLIAHLLNVTALKAFIFCADRNPLEKAGAATALRTLITEIHGAALIRTDLAGLDAFAHDAVFAAIGTRSALRHGRPPRQQKDNGFAPRPRAYVLHPDLMDFFRTDTLIERYRGRGTPECPCSHCDGLPLARFDDSDRGIAEAEFHNLAVWSRWAIRLQSCPAGPRRWSVWESLCQAAVAAHEDVNSQLGYRAFTPAHALREWAGLH